MNSKNSPAVRFTKKLTNEAPAAPVTKKVESKEAQEAWGRIRPHLIEVSSLESLSGSESEVRSYLESKAKKFGYETKTDEVGNLWLYSDAPEGEVLLCAHMDKVGEPRKITEEGDKITGRLDDALGVSMIMGLIEAGSRPSVLFTVEEETGYRGARCAAKNIYGAKEKRPKLVLVLDVSMLEEHGAGPLVYTSSGGITFPDLPLKAIEQVVNENGLRAKLLPGIGNDSTCFARIQNQAVATLQVHVDNMHSPEEVALISDVKEAALVLENIVNNHAQFPELKP